MALSEYLTPEEVGKILRVSTETVMRKFGDREGVIDTASVLRYLTEDQIQWRVSSGRWQRPCRGVIVAHSGSLTERQTLRVAVLSAGPGSALAGLTAAWLDGFIGFGDKTPYRDRTIQLLAPPGRRRRAEQPSGLLLAVRYSRLLSDDDAQESGRALLSDSRKAGVEWHSMFMQA